MRFLKLFGPGLIVAAAIIVVRLYFPNLYFRVYDPCDNRVIDETVSFDKRLKLVVFTRDCGSRGVNTEASLLPAGDQLPNGFGNLFVVDTDEGKAPAGPGGGPRVIASWSGHNEVTIGLDPNVQFLFAEQSLAGVKAKYIKVKW
jgi:hypothetical protein